MTNDLPIAGGDNDLVLEPGQDLVLRDANDNERLRLDAATGAIRIRNASGQTRIRVDPEAGDILIGGSGQDGDLLLFPSSADTFETAQSSLHLNAGGASVGVGTSAMPGLVRVRGNGEGIDLVGERGDIVLSGRVELRTPGGELRARLDGEGTLLAGGAGRAGAIRVRNAAGNTILLLELAGSDAHARFGGSGADGRLELLDGDGNVTVVLNGATGNVGIGDTGGGNAGALFIKGQSGRDVIVLNGEAGNVGIGAPGGGVAGTVFLKDVNGEDSIVLNGATGNIGIGRFGVGGNLFVKDEVSSNTIHLSGATGNINLTGDIRFSSSVADCAEEFDLADGEECDPGAVMILEPGGRLCRSSTAYDTRAVGVVSGAGGYRPGLILDRDEGKAGRVAVAMIGKVFCKVDASYAPIRAGDLLTTSPTIGHAMRVLDLARGAGAIIGKALAPCAAGPGLVPMLVTLQ